LGLGQKQELGLEQKQELGMKKHRRAAKEADSVANTGGRLGFHSRGYGDSSKSGDRRTSVLVTISAVAVQVTTLVSVKMMRIMSLSRTATMSVWQEG
jgi:hypothetical protein